MTRNQIDYNRLLEERRSNRAKEELAASQNAEVVRHNYETERQNLISLDEMGRSNRARESETQRTNLAQEALKGREIDERIRSNLRSEALRSAELAERTRRNDADILHNANLLQEQIRSNKAKESLSSQEINIKRNTLSETIRANQARENENVRSNVAREQENFRSNTAKELETARSNRAREEETARHNKVEEVNTGLRNATYAADVAGRLIYYNKDRNVIVNSGSVMSNSGSPNKGTGPVPPNVGGGHNNSGNPNTGNGGRNNEGKQEAVGSTFWDLYKEVRQAQPRQTFTQGGSYGGNASRSTIKK